MNAKKRIVFQSTEEKNTFIYMKEILYRIHNL